MSESLDSMNSNNSNKKQDLPCLDDITHKCNSACGMYSAVGVIEGKERLWGYARLGCGRWTCPVSGPRKAARLRDAIIRAARQKGLTRLLSLTLDPKKFEGDSVAYINRCWGKLRVYLSRKYGRSISFIRLLEQQKNGNAHFHILIDRFIPYEWIKGAWDAVGGGSVYVQCKDIEETANYCVKYLTKDLHLYRSRGIRHYSTSKDIKLRDRNQRSGWGMSQNPIEYLYEVAEGTVVGEPRMDKEGNLCFFMTEIH